MQCETNCTCIPVDQINLALYIHYLSSDLLSIDRTKGQSNLVDKATLGTFIFVLAIFKMQQSQSCNYFYFLM